MRKNLHNSKICCNFAPSFKKEMTRNTKKTTQKVTQKIKKIMNKTYFTKSLGEIQLTTATINRNFRIKVAGIVNGVRVNKLVGVRGLLAILGSWQKLVKMVLRAFDCLADKCACKIYGGAKVTFYAK